MGLAQGTMEKSRGEPLLTAALTLALTAVPAVQGALQKEISANYAAISQAFVKRDETKIESFFARDYKIVQPNGQGLAHDHVLQAMRWQMKAMQHPHWDRKVRSVTLTGGQAVAIVDGDFSGTIVAPDGRSHVVRQVSTSKDVWIKTPKGYRLRQSQVLKSSATMDGHPMTATPKP